MEQAHLDQALIEAHAQNDGHALVALYTQAADLSEAQGDIDAACFYLTHAFVFALESGAAEAEGLNQRLAARGRARRLVF
jgi:diadenosine tetraphosphate (Ap4A) HIT family hydrolase